MILIYFLCYFIVGLVVALVNWFFIISDDVKDHTSIHLALPISVILWPAIFVGFIINIIKFIEKEY